MATMLKLSVLAFLALPATALADEMSNMNMASDVSSADKALMASMKTMKKNMAVKPSGNPDKDFVSMMMPHHQGAIDMAKVEIKYGKDPILIKMAQDIVAAQEKEIAEMKTWQDKSGK